MELLTPQMKGNCQCWFVVEADAVAVIGTGGLAAIDKLG
jgi:hypothetical protein